MKNYLRIVKKAIVGFALFVILVMTQPLKTSDSLLYKPSDNPVYLRKKIAIYQVLKKYNSPLVYETDSFIQACATYNLDCYLLPAISGVESTFGKFILPGSFNPFGWGGGYILFSSWADGFNQVARGLRENYFAKNISTIEQVGRIYAPPSTTWAAKVEYFMAEFYAAENSTDLDAIGL